MPGPIRWAACPIRGSSLVTRLPTLREDRQAVRGGGGGPVELRSEAEGADRCDHDLGVGDPVDAGDVDVEFDLVAVGIEDVEAVGDGVVGAADDGDVVVLEATEHGP